MIIRTHAYARAGLIGNPSDGYFGKTISLIIRNYRAEVVLYESPELVIVPYDRDISRFASISALIRDVRQHGYYGGVRLIKAAVRRFGDYCAENGIPLAPRNFTAEYSSNIPRLVGMAGSSAIVTAVMRALMQFYGVEIPMPVLPNLILAVEKDELGIHAGLQDRVIQVYEGVVFMDFSREIMSRQGYGDYTRLDPALLPPLYVAFDPARAEGSERVHNHLRARFEDGDPAIVEAMKKFGDLALETREFLVSGRGRDIGPLLNRNFDLRASIMKISAENMAMIRTARAVGASAKFAGSGGTVIGTYEDEDMYRRVAGAMARLGCTTFKPEVA
jgi:glucuronokinase